ncbi:MAG TPA: GAF domain-containing protein [Trichocoleus sp.]
MQNRFNRNMVPEAKTFDQGLRKLIGRLSQSLERDTLVQQTTSYLRETLKVDRVVLYYFYRQWKGRVTFESLSDPKYSVYGETGPDECFNGDYARMYFEGRVRAIPDIEVEPIAECHRDFLRGMNVRANLVVPVLIGNSDNSKRLWGLLVAHHCQDKKDWTEADIQAMQKGAVTLAISPAITNLN